MEHETRKTTGLKNTKTEDSVPFDEALRQLIKVGHIEQGRGKKVEAEKARPKPEKQGGVKPHGS